MTRDAELARAREIMDRVDYRGEDYRWRVEIDAADPEGRVFVQLQHLRPDAVTGVMGWGASGKRYLSEHQTEGEIVRQAFSLALGYEEHEVREFFKWTPDGELPPQAVFGPHIGLQHLYEVAHCLDTRD